MSLQARNWFRLPVFFVVSTLFWCTIYTGLPIISPYAKNLGASLQMIGLIGGSYGLMQLLFRIPLGIASDKLGRRRIFITGGMVIGTLGALTMLLGSSPGWVLLGRTLAGISACSYVQLTVLYISYFPENKSSKYMSIVQAAATASQMLAMMAGSMMADRYEYSAAFGTGAALGLVGILLSLLLYEPALKQKPLLLRDVFRVACSPGLIGVSLIAVILQAIWHSKVLSFAQLVADDMKASGWQLGIITTVAMIGSFVAAIWAGLHLIGRLGEKRIIAIGFFLHFIGCVMIPFSKTIIAVFLSQAISGIGQGFAFPMLMAMSLAAVPKERWATAMGFFQAIYALGMFLGPWIQGIISYSFSLDTGFYFMALLATSGFILTLALIKSKPVITTSRALDKE